MGFSKNANGSDAIFFHHPTVDRPFDQLTLAETSTTLADCVFAAVFHGFPFGNMGTAEAAAEG